MSRSKEGITGLVNNAVQFFDMVGQTEWQQSLERTLVHWIGIHPRHEVLDVGCGPGHFVILLAQRAGFVTGVDASADMVARASENFTDYGVDNATVVVGRAQALPFPAGRFDIVTCLNLLFMFPDPMPLLTELVRVCKPGGQVVLMEPSDKLNPWSAQTYCGQQKLYDFERDSLLAFSTASARYDRRDLEFTEQALGPMGVTRVDRSETLGGLVYLHRLEKSAVD